ncbi:hypothetical protein ACVMIH_005599 [Bradyrhizobium sp. USDA 4503]
MKTALRPKRSARKPRQNVPTNRPAKVAATKAPIPGEAEERLRRRGHQSAAGKARRDIAGKEQVVDFEAAAERE